MTSSGRDFTLDRFQLDAIAHLDAGESVLVAAPTGSGKTIVAEHAIDTTISTTREIRLGVDGVDEYSKPLRVSALDGLRLESRQWDVQRPGTERHCAL